MKSTILLVLLAQLAGILNAQNPPKTEAETYAINYLNQVFIKSGDTWYASTGDIKYKTLTLYEFKGLSLSFSTQKISSTEKLNGISDKLTVSAKWEHYRRWNNGKWTDWITGMKTLASENIGVKLFLSAMPDLRIFFTKKNGQWSQNQINGYSDNRQQTLDLIEWVVHGKIPEAAMENEKKSPPPSIPLPPNTPAPSAPKVKPSITVKLKGVIEEDGKLTIQTDKGEFSEGKETTFGKVISVSREKVETDEQIIIILDR